MRRGFLARHLQCEIHHASLKRLSAGPEPHGGSRTERAQGEPTGCPPPAAVIEMTGKLTMA
jgi:hypothetical protein